jgi:hypothetical protein
MAKKNKDYTGKWVWWSLKRDPNDEHLSQFIAEHGNSRVFVREGSDNWQKIDEEDWKCNIAEVVESQQNIVGTGKYIVYENEAECMKEWAIDLL